MVTPEQVRHYTDDLRPYIETAELLIDDDLLNGDPDDLMGDGVLVYDHDLFDTAAMGPGRLKRLRAAIIDRYAEHWDVEHFDLPEGRVAFSFKLKGGQSSW